MSFWIIVETGTTLGFGEMNIPKSFLGRCVATLSVICGWFLISLLILVAREYLELDDAEKEAFKKSKKQIVKQHIDHQASILILNMLLFRVVLCDKRKKTFPFLLANKNYDIFFFVGKHMNKDEFRKKLADNMYTLTPELTVIVNGINETFLRFYNKITCFNSIYQESAKFMKLFKYLNSFQPNQIEQMNNVMCSINKNFIKFDDYITHGFRQFADDLKLLNDSATNFNEKMRRIFKIQLKISQQIMKVNSKKSPQKNQDNDYRIQI
jgi:hypothetical protein